MNTDTTTPDAKFTLIYYRANGQRYEGCGDYVRFDSEMEMFRDLSRDEVREKLVEKIKHADDCCDSCPQNENEIEFAILKDGKPLAARGDNFYSFQPEEETEETYAASAIYDEAQLLIRNEKNEKAEVERKAKEAAALKAAEVAKVAAEAAQKAKEVEERRKYEELKAKFEAKPEAPVVVKKSALAAVS